MPRRSQKTACMLSWIPAREFSIRLLEAEVADHADDGLDVLYWRGGDDAVAKVEDVSGAAVG